ncbi:hypothetical protein AKUG0410_03020 [Apilactobacillus kunkeei]|nr:hypothetical protein AKUG0412_03020 [Apilactobacillus kunkeei]CAI2632177.1 hypothetical protein AKUG0410_03020 [Apilactobacillus kunkeei]
MKAKRSARLVDMTRYLMENPNTVVPLTFLQIVMILLSHLLVKT